MESMLRSFLLPTPAGRTRRPSVERPRAVVASADGDPAMRVAIGRVVALLRERCAGAGPFEDIGRHVFAHPGKRIRVRLVLACAGLKRLGTAQERDAVEAGAAVELLHEASLVHDDICDAAGERRGVPSVVAAFGIRAAALTGAFFAGHALALLGEVLERRGERLDLTSLTELVEGQVLDCLRPSASVEEAARRYERVAIGKTGVLFRFACEVGALVAELPSQARGALDAFARELALGFQVLDDVRDLERPPDLGKPACNDLSCGVITWPMLCWLRTEPDPAFALQRVVRVPKDAGEVAALRQAIVASGATQCARRFAADRFDAARRGLATLPSGWGRRHLEAIVASLERQ